jgi:hypothetical protein
VHHARHAQAPPIAPSLHALHPKPTVLISLCLQPWAQDLLRGGHTAGILCDIGAPVIHRGVMYNCRIFLLDSRVRVKDGICICRGRPGQAQTAQARVSYAGSYAGSYAELCALIIKDLGSTWLQIRRGHRGGKACLR